MSFKTAATIEEQPERKAARGDAETSPASRPPAGQKLKQRDASRIAAWQYKPGQSGNPTGKRNDLAADLARACFENNMPALYKAFSKALLRGNGYVFKELADRAYGRLKEKVEIDRGPYGDLSEEQMLKQIADLERKLGFTPQPSEPPASDDSGSKSKPN